MKYLSKEFYTVIICAFLISGIGVYVYSDSLTFRYLYIYAGGDTSAFMWPHVIYASDYLNNYGIPMWSFNVGLGQNIFPEGVNDPFTLVLYLIGKENLSYFLGYVIFIKILLSGLIFFLYLRILSLSRYASMVGALLYSFSGPLVLIGAWNTCPTIGIITAFILYSFELYFQKSKWYLFPIAIFSISTFSLPAYMYYFYTILIFGYAAFRYLAMFPCDYKHLFLFLLKLSALYLFGILLGSVFTVPSVYDLLQSPRLFGESSKLSIFLKTPFYKFGDPFEYLVAIHRFFSTDLINVESYPRIWPYQEAPMLYCGLITMILIPQIFKFVSRRIKILYSLVFLFCILYLVFPFFRYIFSGFGGDYYRLSSFWITAIMIGIAAYTLDFVIKKGDIDLKLIIKTTAVLVLILLTSMGIFYFINKNFLNYRIAILCLAFLLIYSFILSNLQNARYKIHLMILLVVLICFELASFSSKTVHYSNMIESKYLQSKDGYFDYSNDAINYIKRIDHDFYRIEKYGYNSLFLNDALFQNYHGTKSFNSFNQKSYVEFIKKMDVPFFAADSTPYINGFENRLILNTLVGVRYGLAKDRKAVPFGYEYIGTFGDVYAFKNKYYLPFGFTYDKYLLYDDFKRLNPSQKDNAILKACILNQEKNGITGLKKLDAIDNLQNGTMDEATYIQDINNLKKNAFNIQSYNPNYIHGKIKTDDNKMLFLSLPYDKGWNLKIDGKNAELRKVNIGFSGIYLSKGEHDIVLKYFTPYLKAGFFITFVCFIIYGILVCGYNNQMKRLFSVSQPP